MHTIRLRSTVRDRAVLISPSIATKLLKIASRRRGYHFQRTELIVLEQMDSMSGGAHNTTHAAIISRTTDTRCHFRLSRTISSDEILTDRMNQSMLYSVQLFPTVQRAYVQTTNMKRTLSGLYLYLFI